MYPISNEVKALFESEQKQILRITGGVKTPIPNSVGPAAIASFDNAVAADALNVTVDITPVQSGSGDPSPTNVRPISGWTGANITKAGNNLLSECSIGTVTRITASTDGETITLNGTVSGSGMYSIYITGLLTVKAGTYTLGANNSVAVVHSGESYCEIRFVVYDHNSGVETRPPKYRLDLKTVNAKKSMTFSEDSLILLELRLYAGQVFNNFQLKPVLVIGNNADETDTTHTRTTIPISWQSEAGTVYGGTLDVTTGLLTVERGNIASYAGETLPGAWISSMDVYTAGGTPTTGAQVVYELATPQTYHLTPTQIALLAGVNNVWADCGDVTVEYETGYEYEINITDADVVIGSFSIDRFSCIGNKLEIGTATSAQMTVKLDNYDGRFNGIVFEGTELFVEIGIADWTQSNPTVNWIPCGYFTPDEQPRSLNIITIHALDRMMQFDATMPTLTPWVTQSGDVMTDSQGNIIYFVSNVQFPVTVQNLVKRVALLCGVPFTQSLSNLPNYNYTLSALPTLQQEITFRNIIQWCAGIMGANAWIDWTGSLRFSWYGATTGYTSTTANRFSSDLHEDDITITGVQYTNTQNVTIVSGSTDYAIDMTGNYLAAVGISTILPNVKNVINGFTYRPFTASVINAPYLWPMDIITFNKDGVNHTCAVTNVNFGINGTTALEGKGETAQTNSGTTPSVVTKEQGFLIEQAAEVTRKIDASMNQEGIFNLLTNNGEAQGIYIIDGQVYVNMSYARSGTLVLGGLNNANGLLRILDSNGDIVGLWDNTGINIEKGSIYFPLEQEGDYIAINKYNTIPFYVRKTNDGGQVFSVQIRENGFGVYNSDNSKSLTTYSDYLYLGGTDTIGRYLHTIQANGILLGDYAGGRYLAFNIYDYVNEYHSALDSRSLVIYERQSDGYYPYSSVSRNGISTKGNLTVEGTKSRVVTTDQYSDRLLYCYETPSPMFGDVGEGTIGEDGKCYIWLDPVFAQTITTTQYQVFLQRYGSGECWVAERKGSYFVVEGTPGMAFGWELKAKQRDFDQRRLERNDEPFTVPTQTYGEDAAKYINDLKKERISA